MNVHTNKPPMLHDSIQLMIDSLPIADWNKLTSMTIYRLVHSSKVINQPDEYSRFQWVLDNSFFQTLCTAQYGEDIALEGDGDAIEEIDLQIREFATANKFIYCTPEDGNEDKDPHSHIYISSYGDILMTGLSDSTIIISLFYSGRY